MQNSIIEANIEISRKLDKSFEISVNMPVWNKQTDSGLIEVSIALFGIRTFASNLEDAELSIKEAIHCFCFSAENFGRGIEKELEELGWKQQKDISTVKLMDFTIRKRDMVMDQLMQAGEPISFKSLAIA